MMRWLHGPPTCPPVPLMSGESPTRHPAVSSRSRPGAGALFGTARFVGRQPQVRPCRQGPVRGPAGAFQRPVAQRLQDGAGLGVGHERDGDMGFGMARRAVHPRVGLVNTGQVPGVGGQSVAEGALAQFHSIHGVGSAHGQGAGVSAAQLRQQPPHGEQGDDGQDGDDRGPPPSFVCPAGAVAVGEQDVVGSGQRPTVGGVIDQRRYRSKPPARIMTPTPSRTTPARASRIRLTADFLFIGSPSAFCSAADSPGVATCAVVVPGRRATEGVRGRAGRGPLAERPGDRP